MSASLRTLRVYARAMEKHAEPRKGAPPSYEAAFSRASKRTFERLERVEAEREVAADHLAELLALSRHERRSALASTRRFQSYSLAAHALGRGEREVPRNPDMAWELVGLSRSLIRHIDPRSCGGADALADLDAYSLAVQGTTLRVRGEFREAFRAFAGARLVQQRGCVDPDLTATIDLLESSLHRDLGQFDTALAQLDRAQEVFVSLGEQQRVEHVVVNRAHVYITSGAWTKAFSILGSAVAWVSDARIRLAAHHNLADVLVKSGRATEAAQVFSGLRSLYDCFGDTVTASRRMWLEGLIVRELGDLQHASGLLEMAVKGFAARGYACDAGLAQLDLVATLRKRLATRPARKSVPHSSGPGLPES